MYGGFFSDFVPISERAMARRLNLTEKKVTDMLHHMDALKIIHYKAKTTKPQIIFTAPRVNVESLTLTESNYNTLKQHATERLEQSSQPCGICDRCIQSHSTTPQPAVRDDIRTAILKHLQQQPLRVDELLEKISGVEESTLVNTLHTLVDERTVSINQSLQFFV